MINMVETHPFYQALVESCQRLDRSPTMALYIFNQLFPNVGDLDSLDSILVSSTQELKAIPGLGDVSADIISMAQEIYKKGHKSQLQMDGPEFRGYATGRDISRWIHRAGLDNKKPVFTDRNCIIFETGSRKANGVFYKRFTELHILSGDVTSYEVMQ